LTAPSARSISFIELYTRGENRSPSESPDAVIAIASRCFSHKVSYARFAGPVQVDQVLLERELRADASTVQRSAPEEIAS
jgi:hypothetical protein